MSNPQVPSDGIKALIQRLVGPTAVVLWANDPEPWDGGSGVDSNGVPIPGAVLPFPTVPDMGEPLRVELDYGTVIGRGMDEKMRTYVPETSPGAGDDKQTVAISGIRHLTLNLKCITAVVPSAVDILERVRTSITLPSSRKELRGLKMALRKIDVTRTVGVPDRDGRMVDAVTLDVFLTFNSRIDDAIGETDYDVTQPRTKDNFIESVTVEGLGVISSTKPQPVGIRFGVSSTASGYNAAFVSALAGQLRASIRTADLPFAASTDKYCFIWIPDSLAPLQVTWDENTVTLDLVATLVVHGVAGKLYRSEFGLGTLIFGVQPA